MCLIILIDSHKASSIYWGRYLKSTNKDRGLSRPQFKDAASSFERGDPKYPNAKTIHTVTSVLHVRHALACLI